MSKKFYFLLLFFALVCISWIIGWQIFKTMMPGTLPQGTVTIRDITFQVDIAATPESMEQGLSGRAALKKRQGMYFVYPSVRYVRFWMKEMKFPLDIIWVKNHQIVGYAADISPPPPNTPLPLLKRYPSPQPVDSVLEVLAGTVAKDQFHVGDSVRFQP